MQVDEYADQANQGDEVEEHVAQDVSLVPLPLACSTGETMLCPSVILPMAPPELLAAPMRMGEMPIC